MDTTAYKGEMEELEDIARETTVQDLCADSSIEVNIVVTRKDKDGKEISKRTYQVSKSAIAPKDKDLINQFLDEISAYTTPKRSFFPID